MNQETPRRAGTAGRRRTRRGPGARIGLCLALAALVLGLLPSLAAAAFPTAKPLFGAVSATPTSDGATLTGTVYPYGLDTHYHFEYGSSPSYTASIPAPPAPEGDLGAEEYPATKQAQQTISGLASGTYHYRLVASNADGTTMSADQTFTTSGPPPTVTDEAATEVAGGFELKGTVNPNGSATSYQFEYGTSIAYGSKIPSPEESVGPGSIAVSVAKTVTGLLPNTLYHFRLAARHPGGSAVFTSDRTFMTPTPPPSAPVATVEAPQTIGNVYHLRGEINPDSLETTYHFEFGTSTSYGTSLPIPDATISAGPSAVAVSQEVTTGLQPNTTYHYKIVAHNSEGFGESADEQFTTPPLKPVVSTLPVSESTAGFTLHGTVNPNGGTTTYHFDFGVTEAYGQSIPGSEVSVGSGTEPVSLSQLVEGLPPGVPYHYRIVAKNAGGATIGEDQFFMTPPAASTPESTAPPVLPTPAIVPAPTPHSSQFTVKPAVTKGTGATMQVSVPGAGTVSASGKGLKAVTATSKGPGVVTLKLKLTGAGMTQLRKARNHKLTVKVKIAFQPNGGKVGTTSKTVTFRAAGT